ncbi:MAG TPA: Re/Si-specific NAD(P)(+) transhydrogenase subunit alpha [Gemmatimonadales bacterium]|nr:Re/Si-specific NAD(P)(+) transhydrogenase subunit alpha [Gemmatimonadales bacterium]
MRIAVPKETAPLERRVGLVPDGVARLVKAGHAIVVEQGAGMSAGIPDAAFTQAGATFAPDFASTVTGADLVTKVQRPSSAEVALLPEGSVLVSYLQPSAQPELLAALAGRRVTALAMELVPRTTKAQSIDALSSQATVAGYKAVLLGAAALPKLLPMMTTAAGTLAPAKVFVLGAGVAGLQAIATARRLGAVVSAFDVRPAVREQVQSLGASFVEAEAVSAAAEGAGGYARELADEQQQKVLEAIGKVLPSIDLVISTAQIPGRPAPRLITKEMVATMPAGSVIVDLAAETGGNCELTRAGEDVVAHGVTIIGAVNLASTVPLHASQMYGRNVLTLLQHLLPKEGPLTLDMADEIVGPMAVTHGGDVRHGR